MLKKTIPLTPCLLAGILLTTLPHAQAQDRNTVTGLNAGDSITTGDDNTLYGSDAGRYIDTEAYNVIVGSQAGIGTLDTSLGETIDTGAVLLNAYSAYDNILIGYRAGWQNHTGTDNVFIGKEAGQFNNGTDNTFIGSSSGFSNTTGNDNTFIGEEAGRYNTTGSDNIFIGQDAGYNNTTASDNVFIGDSAGRNATEGHTNTGIGSEALYDLTTAHLNSAVGAYAGTDNGAGVGNTFVGAHAGPNSEHADFNTMIGMMAGWDNNRLNSTTTGNRNTYLGAVAGYPNREGEDNLVMGAFAGGNRWTDISVENFANVSSWGSRPTNVPSAVTVSRRVILGSQALGSNDDTIAVGFYANSSSAQAIAIGNNSVASHFNSAAIGHGSASHGNNIMVLGNGSTASIDPDSDGTTDLGSPTYRYSGVYAENFRATGDSSSPATVELVADAGTQVDDFWRLQVTDSGTLSIDSQASGSYSSVLTTYNNGDVVVSGDLNVNSDIRLKREVREIDEPFRILEQIEGRTYEWKPGQGRDDRRHYGLVAQEVESAVPELVSTRESDGIKSVNYQGFIPILIDAVNELKEQNQRQQEEIRRLREQLAIQKEWINQKSGS